MQKTTYKITIATEEYVEDAASPCCYTDSHANATEIARPWVEQGHYVILNAVRREDEEDE